MKILAWTRGHFDVTFELLNHLVPANDITLVIQTEKWVCGKTESVLELNNLQQPGVFSRTDAQFNLIAGERIRSLLDAKVQVYIINYPSIRMKNPQNFQLIPRIIRLINSIEPDVIHVHGVNLHFLCLLPFLGKYKKIFTVHDYVPHSGEEAWQCTFFNRIIAKSKYPLITGCAYQSRQFARYYHIPLNRLTAVPFGALNICAKWAARDVSEEQSTVLFFGRISPYKGLEYLIKAEPLISEKVENLKVIIAGDGDFSIYDKMIRNHSCYEIYNHYITNDLAAKLFQRASCVVLPYTDATQSGVLMTAYAFHKPVIVTDVGGLPEVVEHGVTGFIVPPNDESKLALAVIKLLRDSGLRERIKNNIRSRVEGELSWQQIAGQVVDVYQRAWLNQRSRHDINS